MHSTRDRKCVVLRCVLQTLKQLAVDNFKTISSCERLPDRACRFHYAACTRPPAAEAESAAQLRQRMATLSAAFELCGCYQRAQGSNLWCGSLEESCAGWLLWRVRQRVPDRKGKPARAEVAPLTQQPKKANDGALANNSNRATWRAGKSHARERQTDLDGGHSDAKTGSRSFSPPVVAVPACVLVVPVDDRPSPGPPQSLVEASPGALSPALTF